MPRQKAFSLVELLVVLGLIGLLMGGIGLARPGGDRGVALRSGEAQVLALLRAVRAGAISRQTPVRLLVASALPSASEFDAESYLRRLQIAYREDGEVSTWRAEGPPVFLPPGIFVVPEVVPASHLTAGLAWPTGETAPVSFIGTADALTLQGWSAPAACSYIEFEPDGTVNPKAARLILGTARSSRGRPPHFDDPHATRGVGTDVAGRIGSLPPFDGL